MLNKKNQPPRQDWFIRVVKDVTLTYFSCPVTSLCYKTFFVTNTPSFLPQLKHSLYHFNSLRFLELVLIFSDYTFVRLQVL